MNRRQLELALMLVAGGAVVVMLGPFTGLLEFIGLGLIGLGVVLAAPATRGDTAEWWWTLLAAGGLIMVGVLLSLLSGTLGGLLTLVGAVVVLVVAVMALPARAL